jgi:Peptidogalycan biosysnthesis/recognition
MRIYVVYKEFDGTDAGNMELFEERGYLRGTLPVLHKLAGRFRNFGEYLGAIKARYRNQITRSQKKFAAAGLRAVHVADGQEIRRRFTPEVHRLYAAVHAKSKTKLEFLPLECFRELPDALPEQVEVMFVEDMTPKGEWSGLRRRCARMEPTTRVFRRGLRDERARTYLFQSILARIFSVQGVTQAEADLPKVRPGELKDTNSAATPPATWHVEQVIEVTRDGSHCPRRKPIDVKPP